MRRQKIFKIKKEEGITLIALVVTIIILIILATVSINTVFGEGGLIKRAEQAKAIYENAEKNDKNDLEKLEETIKVTNWDLSKVKKVTSEDNTIVPVPIGYTVSTIEGEKSVSTGFVIKEGSDGSAVSGINEYVWVPVQSIRDLYDEANDAGQLWDFRGTTSTKKKYPTTPNTNYREPDIVTKSYDLNSDDYDAILSNLNQAGLSDGATAEDLKKQLQSEFLQMKDSVKKYGGFYIGRYEAGDLSKAKAVVQKYNTDIGSQTWYTMYKLCKTASANDNVVSSMIWGCQWDATLRWMQTSNDEKVKNFSTNSTNYGNYKDNLLKYKESENGEEKTQSQANTKIPTGGCEATKINNIYDMAGNMYEKTIEADRNCSRTVRGGYWSGDGVSTPASCRSYGYPSVKYMNGGTRITLYIGL